MRYYIRSLAFIIATVLLAVPIATSETQTNQGTLSKLELSVGEWPPFLGENLPKQGLIANLLTDVFIDAGYQVEFNFLPWIRAYQVTAKGDYAATAVWMFKEERAEDFYYSDPVLNERFVFIYRKDDSFDWTTMEDLQGKLIGGGLGYSYGAEFDEALEQGVFKQIRLPTVEQNLRMLAAGRTDVYAEEISVAKYTLNNFAPDLKNELVFHTKPILENQSFVLFPKSDPNSLVLLEKFNEALASFRQSGRYDNYLD